MQLCTSVIELHVYSVSWTQRDIRAELLLRPLELRVHASMQDPGSHLSESGSEVRAVGMRQTCSSGCCNARHIVHIRVPGSSSQGRAEHAGVRSSTEQAALLRLTPLSAPGQEATDAGGLAEGGCRAD